MRRIGLFITVLCGGMLFGNRTAAQLAPTISASVDKDSIQLGEPFRLVFTIKTTQPETITLPAIDSIPHFTLLEKMNMDSAVTADVYTYQAVWRLTSFDSGRVVVPGLTFTIGNKPFLTDSLAVTVYFPPPDSTREYHDIKTIIDKENPATRYIPWVLLGITVISLAGFLFFTRAQKEGSIEPEMRGNQQTAYDEALAALAALQQMPLTDPAQVKMYYTSLNDILRRFVQRKFRYESMERTNEELILQLSREEMPRDSFTRLATALRMSDFVKFAKYVPDQPENEKNLEVIRSSVRLLNEIVK